MKFANTKLFTILEKVFDVIYINFLFIILSIPIITMYPALLAMIKTLQSDSLSGKGVFSKFFTNFKNYVSKTMIFSIVFILSFVMVLTAYIVVFNEGNTLFLIILSLILFELIILVFGVSQGYLTHEKVSLKNRYLTGILLGHINLKNVVITMMIIGITAFVTYYFIPLIFFGFGLIVVLINLLNLKWSDLKDEYYIQ